VRHGLPRGDRQLTLPDRRVVAVFPDDGTGQNEAVGRVTLQTIADRVGVSRMTVSNAFSRPDQLSELLRQRILSTAAELGYAGPDPAGRALARGATGVIGVLLTDSLSYAFTDEVATAFMAAIAQEVAATGLALTLLTSSAGQEAIPARDVPMDGALVYSCDTRSPAIEWLKKRGLPLVLVDQAPATGVTGINIDDRGGARAAAQHVVDLGHRRVALLSADLSGPQGELGDPAAASDAYVTRQRILGWLDALTPAGIAPTLLQSAHGNEASGRDAARVLLTSDRPPTAVLCFCDLMAYGVVQGALELGLRVPQDLTVVGFDDSPLAQRMQPRLTTVRQDAAEKGRAAAVAIVAAVQGARVGVPPRVRHLVLPTQLVIRASTAPPGVRD